MLAQICFYVGQGDGVYPHFNKLWEFTTSVVHYVSKESFTWNAPCLWLQRTCRPQTHFSKQNRTPFASSVPTLFFGVFRRIK